MASRLNASYVSILQRFCDVLAIYLGFYIIQQVNDFSFDHQTFLMFLTVVSLFQLLGGLTDFYRSWRGISLLNELFFCFKNLSLSIIVSSAILIFLDNIDLQILLNYFLSVVAVMASLRVAIRLLYALFYKLSNKSRNVVVFGDTSQALKLYQDLKKSEWIGFNPVGLFSFQNEFDRYEYSGDLLSGMNLIQQGNIDKVYVIISQNNIKQADELVKYLSNTTCSTVIVPELFSHDFLYSRVEDINGTPIIPIIDTRMTGVNTLLKRIEDICFSSLILILISPLLIGIAIAIKRSRNSYICSPRKVTLQPIGQPSRILKPAIELRA